MADDVPSDPDANASQFGNKNADRRREPRRSTVGRARLILETPGAPSYDYLLFEASDHGYRLSGTSLPDLSVGGTVMVELADGAKHQMVVRWVEQGEIGLEIMPG